MVNSTNFDALEQLVSSLRRLAALRDQLSAIDEVYVLQDKLQIYAEQIQTEIWEKEEWIAEWYSAAENAMYYEPPDFYTIAMAEQNIRALEKSINILGYNLSRIKRFQGQLADQAALVWSLLPSAQQHLERFDHTATTLAQHSSIYRNLYQPVRLHTEVPTSAASVANARALHVSNASGRKVGITISDYSAIQNYRNSTGLPAYEYADKTTGAVSRIETGGKVYYGVSTGLQGSAEEKRQLRVEAFEAVRDSYPGAESWSQAQFLLHAEAHAILQLAQDGMLPKEITMFVDRPTCKLCVYGLPYLMKAYGIERITILSGGSAEPLEIRA